MKKNNIDTTFTFAIAGFLMAQAVIYQMPAVMAADIIPPPPSTAPPGGPSDPPAASTPPADRPSIDPGIIKRPPAEPHPESVVTPPVVDPGMAIHPQDAPPQTPDSSSPPSSSPSERSEGVPPR